MNLQHERIAALCGSLNLQRIAVDWPALADEAARSETSFADFVERLLKSEIEARGERQRHTLLKLATLPTIKTLEQFDFTFATGAPRAQIQELAGLTFIERAENLRRTITDRFQKTSTVLGNSNQSAIAYCFMVCTNCSRN